MTQDAIAPGEYSHELLSLLQGFRCDSPCDEADWDALSRAAQPEGVLPLLYDAIQRNGHTARVSPPLLAQLAACYRRVQVANVLLLDKVLRDVLRRFAEAGVPVIVLKGAALAELVYGDIGLRPMGDLDLLVRPGDAGRAVAVLLDAGYQARKPELRPGFDREFRVEAELLAPGAVARQVEIHWRLIGPLFACRHVDYGGVWERAAPVTIADQPAHVLGPEDWVLHQAAHAVYKHRRVGLLDLCDVDRLIRYLDGRLDWDALLEIGRTFRWLPALAAVLSQAAALLDTPAPEWVIRQARAYRLPATDRWLMRWWLAPARPERHHIVPDWLTLPSWGARARFIWAYLFPSRSYIEACYPGRPAGQWPWLYLRRWWSEAVSR